MASCPFSLTLTSHVYFSLFAALMLDQHKFPHSFIPGPCLQVCLLSTLASLSLFILPPSFSSLYLIMKLTLKSAYYINMGKKTLLKVIVLGDSSYVSSSYSLSLSPSLLSFLPSLFLSHHSSLLSSALSPLLLSLPLFLHVQTVWELHECQVHHWC